MNLDKIQKYLLGKNKVEVADNTVIFEVAIGQLFSLAEELQADKNFSLKLITATDERSEKDGFKIWYVFGASAEQKLLVFYVQLKTDEEFPSITPLFHSAWNYEKKIMSFFGLKPVGHPDERQIILHEENWPTGVYPLRKDFDWQKRPAVAGGKYEFQKVGGEGIYEIPVGPIHAGIIEPGHFRFSVAGEEIVLLEPRLGYVHKGSEKLFEVLPLEQKIKLSEKISGDSSFSHSLAFCQALEQLGGVVVPERARYLRVIYAELERLANHFGDIGAMMLDTGFNFGGAQGARLREIILQINEQLTGSRFLRGVNVLGGVSCDIDDEKNKSLSQKLTQLFEDFSEVMAVAETSTSLLNRLKGTGTLEVEIAVQRAASGVAAKAVGLAMDTRADFPYAAYDKLKLEKIVTEPGGDAYARFYVRVKEVFASLRLIEQALRQLPGGALVAKEKGNFSKNVLAISLVEGWRGEIIYFVKTDGKGNLTRVALRDPSFINWTLVGHAGAGNVVPDFPLINKSFNLSYTGNDL